MEDTFVVCLSCAAEDFLLCFACVSVLSGFPCVKKKKKGIFKVYLTKAQQINTDLFQTVPQMNVLQMPPHGVQRFRHAGTVSAKHAL